MSKIFAAVLLFVFMTGSAYAGTIGTISLVDVQGQSDTSLLVGASDEQIAQYFPDGKMPSQILAFYVRIEENDVLFDAGLQDGKILMALMEKGVNPNDVKTILITHLHPDHFGGLVSAEGGKSFPNAEVYVSEVERDYWCNVIKNENVINALALYEVHTFAFGDEVIAGVTAVDASGHTPGHTVYDIKAGDEELLVVGDIMHFPEIQFPLPGVSVKYDVDPVKAAESRRKILELASEKKIPIAGMHITPPGIFGVKVSGEGYEKF